MDLLMTAPGAVNDDLLGRSSFGFLRLGNGQWNLTFFLLRTRIGNGSRLRGWQFLRGLNNRGSISAVPPVVLHPGRVRNATIVRVSATECLASVFMG